MLKIIGFIAVFFATSEAVAQKVLHKIIDAQEIEQISINGNGMHTIEVISEARNTIEMVMQIDGEYAASTLLNNKIIGAALSIHSSFSPYFKKDNDKLSAHKIESISLTLRIPNGYVLGITSDMANLNVSGIFAFVDVSLENGSCTLSRFIGDANLVTKEGDILVETRSNDVSGILFSKLGEEINELPEGHRYLIEAYSLRGNIALRQTEK